MENLNDLIWTDKEDDGDVCAPAVEMHTVCMVAFCGDSAGPTGAPCGHEWVYKTSACL